MPVSEPVRTLPPGEQRRFDEYFLEAVRQKQKQNYDAEAQLLDAALEVDPDASEALYERALLNLSFSSYDDTLMSVRGDSMLRRAVALQPDNAAYQVLLAGHCYEQGLHDEAAAIYKRLADRYPKVEYLAHLLQIQEASGDHAGAVETITRLETQEGKNETLSIAKFKNYNAMNDKEHAYAAIEALCAEYPEDLRYRVLLGDLYMEQGYTDMAHAVYRDVLTLEPGNPFAQISLLAYYKRMEQDSLYQALLEDLVLNPATQTEARVEAMRGYVGESLKADPAGGDTATVMRLFRHTLELPQETADLARMQVFYIAMAKLDEVRLAPALKRVLAIDPTDSQVRLQLLGQFLKRQNFAEAAKLCHDGAIYDPEELAFPYYEGISLLQTDRKEDALHALQVGVDRVTDESDPDVASDLYAALGDILHEMNRDTEAFAAYEEAIRMNNANLMCLNNYAYFLSLRGERLDHAEAMSRRTVDASPEEATYLDTYAWILYQQKKYAEARTYIDRALKLTPEAEVSAAVLEHAGDIYYRAGDRKAALSYWVKALGHADKGADRARLKLKVKRRRL